jgi:sugar O-acyltransferase (sialic acid O-acetyltransferase NeuD family)
MKQALVIFGAGKIAEAVSYFFERDSGYAIAAYICDDAFVPSDTFLGKPLVGVSKAVELYPPGRCAMCVAVGYQGINELRASKYDYFKRLGYSFASYVSPFVKGNFTIGENTVVMDHAMIQPCVTIGNDVFVWGGSMVGHHAVIEDHCWLTGGCMVGGAARIGTRSFVGLGAIVGQEVHVGEKCMLGASTLTTKNIGSGTVLITPPTEPHRLNSDQFTRMSACFRTPTT